MFGGLRISKFENDILRTMGSSKFEQDFIAHHGIKGQKWGVRRFQNKDGTRTPQGRNRAKYRSRGVRAAIARHENEKINKSFRKWKENSEKRQNAIDIGLERNKKKLAYEADRKNADLKREYKQADREYKKAFRSNTTYRKGQIKDAVYSDLSRKHYSEAKKVEKELLKDPYNKDLQKRYSKLMSQYNVERATARKAPAKYAKRSQRKANAKRYMTMTMKSAAYSGAAYAGKKALDAYMRSL